MGENSERKLKDRWKVERECYEKVERKRRESSERKNNIILIIILKCILY